MMMMLPMISQETLRRTRYEENAYRSANRRIVIRRASAAGGLLFRRRLHHGGARCGHIFVRGVPATRTTQIVLTDRD